MPGPVIAYGTPLVEDPTRIGQVNAVGLDEVLFARQGRWRTQAWSTQIVDVHGGQLLDVIEGRSSAGTCTWFAERPPGWCEAIDWAVLDLSGPWRLTFDTMQPHAGQVADPVPHRAARQPATRRGPPPGPERHARPPGPRPRPALAVPQPAHPRR